MKYLLHGIFQQESNGSFPAAETCVVAPDGLAAAVSLVGDRSPAPSIASLLQYEKVIEAIHARQAVIPLRYGCLMESESAILRLLENHGQEYRVLLGRLRGNTEMGIRILRPARPGAPPDSPSSPGARYLASLRSRYGCTGVFAPEEAQLADRISGRLAGLYTEQQREVSASGRGRLLSLYFLTPKAGVERFRQTVSSICPGGAAKLLVSGPWPPYNFVVSAG